MYKKFLLIATTITILGIAGAIFGLRLIDHAQELTIEERRSVQAREDAEMIQAMSFRLENYAYLASSIPSTSTEKSFWKIYGQLASELDRQVIPLHNGDCEKCHRAMHNIAKSVDNIHGIFAKLDSSKESNDDAFKAATLREISIINCNADTVTRIARAERRQALLDAKVETVQDAAIQRSERSVEFVRSMYTIKEDGDVLRLGLNNSKPILVQQGLSDLSRAVKQKGELPPLNGDCYSCHLMFSDLRNDIKAVKTNAIGLFDSVDTQDREKSLAKFAKTISKFNVDINKIVKMAARSAKHRSAETTKHQSELRVFIIVVSILIIVASISLSLIAALWIRRRLSAFKKAIGAISDGNYSYILGIHGSQDEISDLAHTFNLMTSRIRSSQDELTELNQELQGLYMNTIKAFVEAIEAKDPYTRGHSENVAHYTTMLARGVGLSPETVDELYVAALLHDIGKIGIREDVLNKPAALTKAEVEHIKTHPLISAQIVGNIPNLSHIATIIKHHHEFFNGHGYVDGLAGADIPYGSRILAVADAFDAMTSTRPYRSSTSFEAALSELEHNAGTQFDPELVKVFVKVFREQDLLGGDSESAA